MSYIELRNLSEAECRSLVYEYKQNALIFFIAHWSSPCKEMLRVYQSVAGKLSLNVALAYVELDEVALLAAECEIISIPTAVLFINGKIKDKIVGTRSCEEICKITEKGLGEQNGAKGL